MLYGTDKGKILSFNENSHPHCISLEAGGNGELGRIDYTGDLKYFKSQMLFGSRQKVWLGWGFAGFGVSWSAAVTGGFIIGTNVSLGISLAPMYGINAGYNKGIIKPKK